MTVQPPGDQDMVIPSELLERTWAYFHTDADSTTTGMRQPGAHGMSTATIQEVGRWLESLPTQQKAAS